MFEEILRVKNMFTFKRVRVTLELGLGWLDPFNISFHTFLFHTFFFSSFLLRLGELKGTNIVSEPKKVATPTNTHPHTKGNQDHVRAQEGGHINQCLRPHEGTQNSEPKKVATATNTNAAKPNVALRTATIQCLGKNNFSL